MTPSKRHQIYNLKKQLFILLLISFGLTFLPRVSYACHSKADMSHTSSCKKGKRCDKENTSCCADQSQKDKGHNCDGNCNHGSCHCPAPNITVVLPCKQDTAPVLFTAQKQKYHLPTFVLSKGFYSIWLPPKIS